MTPLQSSIFWLSLLLTAAVAGCGQSQAAGAALLSDPPTGGAVTTAAPVATSTALATATATRVVPPTAPAATRTPFIAPDPTETVALPTTEPTTPPAISGTSCDIEHVVIISVDGLRPDALERADTPVFDTLKTKGSYTASAKAVVPSVTLVNHASMLGGMSPEKHGVYWNSDDTGLGKINGPTMFSVAHNAGFSTAMVVGKPKLEDLVLPGSVDRYVYAGFLDRQVTAEALALLEDGLPNVLFIHLPDVDSAGHATGWMSPGQIFALSWTDGHIGEIVATLEANELMAQTLLIITSDHGGSGKAHGTDSPADTTIPWLAIGPGVPAGGTLRTPIIAHDTAATALYALDLPLPKTWDGQPILEIFDKAACRR